MDNLIIQGTDVTPSVNFDLNSGIFEISGVSRPEDVIVFYDQPLDWLREFEDNLFDNPSLKAELPELVIMFKMSYYNSSSSKYLIQILSHLKKIENSGIGVAVKWYYEEGDEKMREDGEDLADAVEFDFEYIEYED